jgi:polyhydroxyalkanoate synthesis regulator phasin
MFDIIRKSIFAGIGAIALTEEKAQEVINEFVQKGELSEKEGETLGHELQKVIDDHKAKLTATIDDHVKKVLGELHLVTKDDLAALEHTLQKDFAKIDKRLAKLEKQLKSTSPS